MATEPRRICGYRKVGGTYLCGGHSLSCCDRLPRPLTTCSACGNGIKVSRGFTKINPLRLFGPHGQCSDRFRPCFVCDPEGETAFIMGVGEKYYTPESFIEEALRFGISKRIPFIPKEMELGKTIVYLAHPKACESKESMSLHQALAIVGGEESSQPRLIDTERVEYKLGIFCAFIAQRVEKLIWEKDTTPEEMESLKKRGITPVIIRNGDVDHA